MGFKLKIPRPDKWIPHKIPKPKLPNVGSEIKKALSPVYNAIHEVSESVNNQIGKLRGQLDKTIDEVEKGVSKAVDEVETTANEAKSKVDDLGNEIAKGLNQGFGELVELVQNGALKPAFDKILSELQKEIFEGDAPIVLRTAYLDIELTDAKELARVIRDMITEGLPTSKREWRYILVYLAPVAIEIKPGIPLIAQVTKRIPLEDLERSALEALLKKAGL